LLAECVVKCGYEVCDGFPCTCHHGRSCGGVPYYRGDCDGTVPAGADLSLALSRPAAAASAALTAPATKVPGYTIDAPNIGHLVTAKGETWKAYPQSANGPCDDTVHGYYWDDDQPILYVKDVRDRPSCCAQHFVPLEELSVDLAHARTTPSFAWVPPDDCSDMEGGGRRVPANRADRDHELPGVAHPALPRDHHVRRG
jgi:hypothetical protein